MEEKRISHILLFFCPKGDKMAESKFQSDLIKELKQAYPGAYIFKNNAKQGYPDLVMLYKNKWATLEAKDSATAKHQPNQDIHVERMNKMSFSSFIYPENKEVVLNALAIHMGR